jgi:hypothetical protein
LKVLHRSAQDHAANAAKSIDSDFQAHVRFVPWFDVTILSPNVKLYYMCVRFQEVCSAFVTAHLRAKS